MRCRIVRLRQCGNYPCSRESARENLVLMTVNDSLLEVVRKQAVETGIRMMPKALAERQAMVKQDPYPDLRDPWLFLQIVQNGWSGKAVQEGSSALLFQHPRQMNSLRKVAAAPSPTGSRRRMRHPN
jgi:hypothetical protein